MFYVIVMPSIEHTSLGKSIPRDDRWLNPGEMISGSLHT
jgi:hypothetical protein